MNTLVLIAKLELGDYSKNSTLLKKLEQFEFNIEIHNYGLG